MSVRGIRQAGSLRAEEMVPPPWKQGKSQWLSVTGADPSPLVKNCMLWGGRVHSKGRPFCLAALGPGIPGRGAVL